MIAHLRGMDQLKIWSSTSGCELSQTGKARDGLNCSLFNVVDFPAGGIDEAESPQSKVP